MSGQLAGVAFLAAARVLMLQRQASRGREHLGFYLLLHRQLVAGENGKQAFDVAPDEGLMRLGEPAGIRRDGGDIVAAAGD
jgi:hypothetical protein